MNFVLPILLKAELNDSVGQGGVCVPELIPYFRDRAIRFMSIIEINEEKEGLRGAIPEPMRNGLADLVSIVAPEGVHTDERLVEEIQKQLDRTDTVQVRA